MTGTVQRRWLIGAASDLAKARQYLSEHFPAGGWHLELLGLEEDNSSSGGARISVRCAFDLEADAEKFTTGYLAGGAAPSNHAPAPVDGEGAAFAEGAKRIMETSKPVSAGKLNFIDLETVRSHFGDKWQHMSKRAEALVRRAIERRLGPTDIYRKTSDLNFVIVFGNLTAREAELKCGVMSEEITRMLVGDELGGGMLSVKTFTANVDATAALQKLSPANDIATIVEEEIETERLAREAPPPDVLPAPTATGNDPLAAVEFVYRPIWDVKRSAVANYYLLPLIRQSGGRMRYGDVDMPGTNTPEGRQNFYYKILDRAIGDLTALQKQDRRLLISFPIHFDILSTVSRRNDVLTRWRTMPTEYRKLGVFEIVGAPEGVPQGRMLEVVSHMRTEARGVFVRIPLTASTLKNFSDTGVTAVGPDIGQQTGSEERIMAQLRDFVAATERGRLQAYVNGLRSFSLTISAIASGFAYVNGDHVSSITDHPEEAYRFSLSDLYAQQLKGGMAASAAGK